jgi:AmmeMemoRadiSam system protein B
MSTGGPAPAAPTPRPPAVAGLFYPGGAGDLRALVHDLLAAADEALPVPTDATGARLAGILVPHAGLVYSGLVAAAAWRLLRAAPGDDAAGPTVVILGTNHGAAWLSGVGAWDAGAWRTPLDHVAVDAGLVRDVIGLGQPFAADAACHRGEHSIEVQVPFLQVVAPRARIVPLSVGTGTGNRAIEAGERLGRLLAERRAAGASIVLAISTDMAHYPRAAVAERITATLLPHLVSLDPAGLAAAEALVRREEPHTSCGMCGIEPAVLGLAALRAMGAGTGTALAAATSADAGGDPGRTVGYLAVAYPQG